LGVKEREIKGQVPNSLFDKEWVVYAKQPFGGPKQVISYLGRYTHRTAISNDRITEVTDRSVTFTWKDYRKNNARQTTTLKGKHFLDLFCQHILPPGFTRIRHYGILSSASKTKSLQIIRNALGVQKPLSSKPKSWQEIAMERMGVKPGICKCCGGEMVVVQTIPNRFRERQRAPPLELTGIF
jgi:hypothetical protein